MKLREFAVIFLLTGLASVSQGQNSGPGQTPRLSTLDGVIPHVELTSGAEAIGGATIEDAVLLLRQITAFPICLESKEFSRERDSLTLGDALSELRTLKATSGLTPRDEMRLRGYEEFAKTQNASIPVGFKRSTFSLTRDTISVRTFLDTVTQLDPGFSWKNVGTESAPLIVIQPRENSVLDWQVPASCGAAQSLVNLYGRQGSLTAIFHEHQITRVEVNGQNTLPDINLNLCKDPLNARDVLDATVRALGGSSSWTLSGIKGLRWLSFDRNAT